jgi:hypothetical protein
VLLKLSLSLDWATCFRGLSAALLLVSFTFLVLEKSLGDVYEILQLYLGYYPIYYLDAGLSAMRPHF